MGGSREADEATWRLEGDGIRCNLCPNLCLLHPQKVGKCGGRMNNHGRMRLLNYGHICVSTVDPIEKKPIFHYAPGVKVLSLGTFGCNLRCLNCQNSILVDASPDDLPSRTMSPDDVVKEATERGARGIAFTFNEPNIWFEFIKDVSETAQANGLFVLLNTNGYIQRKAAEDLLKNVQVMNIDVKGFNEAFYQSNCGGHLAPVLETCLLAREKKIHVELTYLLIPGLNDSSMEIRRFCVWVAEDMGKDTPVHFFRFFPSHKLEGLPEQTMEKMDEAYKIARSAGIRFVYFGGVVEDEHQNTHCPDCGAVLIERNSIRMTDKVCFKQSEVSRFCPTFNAVKIDIDNGKCRLCGRHIPILLNVNEEHGGWFIHP